MLCLFVALLASLALSSVSPNDPSDHAPGSACWPTDAYARYIRAHISEVATGTDTSALRLRAIYKLPAVPDAAIYFVHDSTTCARAALAHARAERTSTKNPDHVYALRVGRTRYLVFNGTKHGEFTVYYVFDSAFKYVGGYMT